MFWLYLNFSIYMRSFEAQSSILCNKLYHTSGIFLILTIGLKVWMVRMGVAFLL